MKILFKLLFFITYSLSTGFSQDLKSFEDSASYSTGKAIFEYFNKVSEDEYGFKLSVKNFIAGVKDFDGNKYIFDSLSEKAINLKLEELKYSKQKLDYENEMKESLSSIPHWDSAYWTTYIDNIVDNFEATKDTSTFTVVEIMPLFPGGEEKLYEYLGTTIIYPLEAREQGIQGKVYVQFIVETDGEITNEEVVLGIGNGCDKEALRVVREMPRWIPGFQREERVRVKYTLPIVYQLRN